MIARWNAWWNCCKKNEGHSEYYHKVPTSWAVKMWKLFRDFSCLLCRKSETLILFLRSQFSARSWYKKFHRKRGKYDNFHIVEDYEKQWIRILAPATQRHECWTEWKIRNFWKCDNFLFARDSRFVIVWCDFLTVLVFHYISQSHSRRI